MLLEPMILMKMLLLKCRIIRCVTLEIKEGRVGGKQRTQKRTFLIVETRVFVMQTRHALKKIDRVKLSQKSHPY